MDEAPVDQSNYVALPAVKEGERAAMDFKISIEEKKKKETESEYFQLLKLRSTEKFKKDAQVAVRVAFGVLAADMVQTRNPDYENGAGAIEEGESKWLLLPSFYYLGGLSIAAIMVIFSAGKNLGETIKQTWQGFIGVAIALFFNIFIFQIVPLTQENKVMVTFTLDGVAYYVSQRDFYTIFPIMIAFTFGILILPMSPGTKKFAVGMNLSVMLTLINPMNPFNPQALKPVGDATFSVSNIMKNFGVYFVVGLVGSLISIVAMIFPYPLLAIKQLQGHIKDIHSGLDDMMI